MVDTPADILRKARKERGFRSAAEAARYLGVPVATFTSHENGTRGHKGIPREAAQLYAAKFGNVSEQALMGLTTGDKRGQQIAPNVLVLGDAAMGIWLESDVAEKRGTKDRVFGVPGSDTRYAVRVIDESVNLRILPGEFAIYEPLPPHKSLQDGWLVLIDRKRNGLLERSIRRVELRSDGKARLVVHSSLERLREVLTYPSSKPGEEIVLVGHIVGKFVEFE